LRQTAVFFRFILVFPALIVQEAVSLGSYPLLLVMWVWELSPAESHAHSIKHSR